MPCFYAIEKFTGAVHGMATSTGSLNERVRDAYCYHIRHVKAEEVPESVRGTFLEILEIIQKPRDIDPEESLAAANTAALSDDEAMDLANKIVRIYDEIRDAHKEAENSK